MQEMINRAKELLADKTVDRVLGWRIGDLPYNPEPSYFETAEDLEQNFVYDGFCGANLSKYMIEGSKLEGKTLVFLKPCDTYSFNQLKTFVEHRGRVYCDFGAHTPVGVLECICGSHILHFFFCFSEEGTA